MQGRPSSEEEIAATRARLVEVALAILQAEGRDAVSLRRVATEAGMSRSTPYLYFADKAALLDAARVASLERLADQCEAAQLGATDIAGRLAATGQAYVTFALDQPALYDLIFEPVPASEAHDAAIRRYRALAEAPLREAWEQGLTVIAPTRLAHVLWASTHGLLALARAGKLRHGVELTQALEDLRFVLAYGFTPRVAA